MAERLDVAMAFPPPFSILSSIDSNSLRFPFRSLSWDWHRALCSAGTSLRIRPHVRAIGELRSSQESVVVTIQWKKETIVMNHEQ